MQTVAQLPAAKLDQVKIYLDALLEDAKSEAPDNQSLKGIWRNTGIGSLSDLEEELQTVRNELHYATLKRKI